MKTGHVGAEYVEHVLRHKRNLAPRPNPLRLRVPEQDGVRLAEPDMSIYDPPVKTSDPGPLPAPTTDP